MSEPINDLESIIENIRHYLELNPNAADTLDGVIKWWLSKKFKNVSINNVREGLELLVEQGVVERTKPLDGKDIYSYGL